MMPTREVSSAAELVQELRANIVDVQFFALEAKIDEQSDVDEFPSNVVPAFSMQVRQDGAEIGVRLSVRLELGVGQVHVDAAATYVANEEFTMGEPASLEFANEVGVMALLPYIRQAIADLTQKVFGNVVLLPVVQRGAIQFTRNDG